MQHRLQPTAEQAAVIEKMMKAPYPVTIGSIAKRLGTSECDAAALLSADVAAFVAGDASARFAEVWEALADWEKVTLFIIHAGNVFEIEGSSSRARSATATTTSSRSTRRSAATLTIRTSGRLPSCRSPS